MKVTYTFKNIIHIILFFIIIIAMSLLVAFNINKYFSTKKVINLEYEIKKDVDYKVYLKKNNDYETEYLEKDMKYIASLIDYIDFDYTYQAVTSDVANYDYTYHFEAFVTISDKDKNLYVKKYELTDPKTITASANLINIHENIKINYDEYNNLIRNFKKNYSLTAASKVEVKLVVDLGIGYNKFKQSDKKITDVVVSSFPLTEQLVNISIDTNNSTKKDVLREYSSHEVLNYAYLFVALFMLIIDVIAIVWLFRYLFKLRPANYEYIKYINDMLKKYDRYIVNVKKLPNLKNLTVVDVTSFEEIIDSRDSLQRPILFHQDLNKTKSTFIIINSQEAYRFVLLQSQFGKENDKKKV